MTMLGCREPRQASSTEREGPGEAKVMMSVMKTLRQMRENTKDMQQIRKEVY